MLHKQLVHGMYACVHVCMHVYTYVCMCICDERPFVEGGSLNDVVYLCMYVCVCICDEGLLGRWKFE